MISQLSNQSLHEAASRVPCRQHQLQQLAIYYNDYLPSPPILVAHGLEHTGKLESIVALLSANDICHAVVRTVDCLSQRHLIAKIFATCIRKLEESDEGVRHVQHHERIDGLNSMLVSLQNLFEGRTQKFVLVIDGIDRQRGTTQTLLPALAKLGDLIPSLSLILTSSSSRSVPLHRAGIPYVHFPPYTRAEAITIVTKKIDPMPHNLPETLKKTPESQVANIYRSFVTTVYDTLTTHTSSTSLPTFQRTCAKLWPRFVWPMLSEEAPKSRHSSNAQWDFARLLACSRTLFQSEGEKALQCRLTVDPAEAWTFDQLISRYNNERQSQPVTAEELESKEEIPFLKSFSSLLLVSSYLASHGPPKHDMILFSRLSSSSTNKRKYLSSALSKSRTGGVRKTPTKKKIATSDGPIGDETPSKKRKSANETSEGLAGERTPKSTRLLLEKTSNIPRPFTLERVIAILRAIHPDGLPRTKGAADKVYAEMAELERLKLVVRCGEAGARAADDGLLEEKWKINVSRDFVIGIGKYWGMVLEGWEID